MQKFSNLKNYYKRELNKYRKLRSGDEDVGFKPKWIHFTRMEFLNDVVEAEEGVDNLAPSQKESEKILYESLISFEDSPQSTESLPSQVIFLFISRCF